MSSESIYYDQFIRGINRNNNEIIEKEFNLNEILEDLEILDLQFLQSDSSSIESNKI